MSNGAGAAVATAGAKIANAIKASGVVIRVDPGDFRRILERAGNALVVHAEGGVFSTSYRYLLSYRGFVFHTKSREPISLPGRVETVRAAKVLVPE